MSGGPDISHPPQDPFLTIRWGQECQREHRHVPSSSEPLPSCEVGGRGDGGPLTCPILPRRQSGSFLSTGWFTMILALELCEEIVVYGMVSENYCRSDWLPGWGWGKL